MAVEIETREEMLAALRQHVLQLNALNKNLQSDKNFDDLENECLVAKGSVVHRLSSRKPRRDANASSSNIESD